MKKGLLGSTALIGAATILSAAAGAAEAPTWKLTGNANFQLYWADQDDNLWTKQRVRTSSSVVTNIVTSWTDRTGTAGYGHDQDHDWYFGVDEAELQLNVSGAADNGLNYGFKIEINANTTDGTMADEVRLQFSGGWGTLQLGDEDGAEDIMNFGGENLMGATGGFDGDQDDYVVRLSEINYYHESSNYYYATYNWGTDPSTEAEHIAAPMYPTIAGDTSDGTKISYFSPRFSGFQVGASVTPTPNNGDDFKEDGAYENHIGIGANYDQSFGDLRIRASAVYSGASSNDTEIEDISAWSVGGIVGWGPFSLGANYTDNGDSGEPVTTFIDIEKSYWNVAAGFETGPFNFALGYFVGTADLSFPNNMEYNSIIGDETTYEHFALTTDFTMAPGLGLYAEINLIEDTYGRVDQGTTSFVAGANVSF